MDNQSNRNPSRRVSHPGFERVQGRRTRQSLLSVGRPRLWMGAVAVIILASMPLAGQALSGAAKVKDGAKTWTPPRTPDGKPDLQGVWAYATLTPLERPNEFAGKEVLSTEEAAEFEKRPQRIHPPTTHNAIFLEPANSVIASKRTSLIEDPPDGKLPPLTPEAQKRLDDARVQDEQHGFDGPESQGIWVRCISAGLPTLPGPYNNSIQIVQAPGYVAVLREMIHEARIIPTDGRPHVPASIRTYEGDSRGHWEGDTLVVDTTNFPDKYNYYRNRDYPREAFSPGLHLVERFTRVDANTISYEATVEDPSFTKSWTLQVPMTTSDSPVYEYACHEGNYGLADTLRGARVQEKKAAEEAAKKGQR
jgi:hypothetical protein